MCGVDFSSVRFSKHSDSVHNAFGLVRFEKTQFALDIIVIYYLCDSRVVNLQQILQHYCYIDELCISDFVNVVNLLM